MGCNLTDGSCINGTDLDDKLSKFHLDMPLVHTHLNLTQPDPDKVIEHHLNFDKYLMLDYT